MEIRRHEPRSANGFQKLDETHREPPVECLGERGP